MNCTSHVLSQISRVEPAVAKRLSTDVEANEDEDSNFRFRRVADLSKKEGLGALVARTLYANRYEKVFVPELRGITEPLVAGRPFVLAVSGAWVLRLILTLAKLDSSYLCMIALVGSRNAASQSANLCGDRDWRRGACGRPAVQCSSAIVVRRAHVVQLCRRRE